MGQKCWVVAEDRGVDKGTLYKYLAFEKFSDLFDSGYRPIDADAEFEALLVEEAKKPPRLSYCNYWREDRALKFVCRRDAERFLDWAWANDLLWKDEEAEDEGRGDFSVREIELDDERE